MKNYPLFRKVLSELDSRYGIRTREVVLDGKTRKETAQMMRDADLLLLTSRSEGSPQVVKEALSANLPVVSTRVGDVETLLDGVLCPAGFPECADVTVFSVPALIRNPLQRGYGRCMTT